MRTLLLAAANSPRSRRFVEHSRLTRPVVSRFIAGRDLDHALPAVRALSADRLVSLDRLGEATGTTQGAQDTESAYTALLQRLRSEQLADRVEVSVKLTALGLRPDGGDARARDHAGVICAAARKAGTTVTIDMEQYPYVERTLQIVSALRADFADTGAVLQAYLRRTEGDCRELSGLGSRIRLCKGAYDEARSVAFGSRAEVKHSYRTCLRILMSGKGYPMVATHDPNLIREAADLAAAAGRGPDGFEYQMLYGIRTEAQRELASRSVPLRIYVPYGDQWYPYFMRRLGERPANLAFFLRSFLPRSGR